MKPVLATVVRSSPAVCNPYAAARSAPTPTPATYPDRGSERNDPHANGASADRRDREPHGEKREERDRARAASCTWTNVTPQIAVTPTRARRGARRITARILYAAVVDDRHRHVRPARARSADLGHGPLQLPLRLLHAEGGLRPRAPIPAAPRAPHVRGDRARRARVRRPRGAQAPHHRRRAAPPPRPRAADRQARCSRRRPRRHPHDERVRSWRRRRRRSPTPGSRASR